jgi:DNA-directed RNA polymerase subunit RPC12/RpoP
MSLMPEPMFFCHSCKKIFRKVTAVSQYDEGEIVCPHCGSDDIEESRLAFCDRPTKKSA